MLRNVENYSPSDTVSHPRRTEYSATLWWEPHNSQRDPHQSHPTGKKKNAPFKLQNTALCPLKNRTDEMFRGNTLKGNCMSAVLVRRTALATESGGWGSFADKEERKLSAYPLPALSSSIQWITSRRKQDKKTGWENQWVKPFKPELNLNIRNQTHWKKKGTGVHYKEEPASAVSEYSPCFMRVNRTSSSIVWRNTMSLNS